MASTKTPFAQRRERLAAEFASKQIECLIVASPANVRYLSGFTGDNGALLVTERGTMLFTDPRYTIQASEESDCRLKITKNFLLPEVVKQIARRKLKRIGFERQRASYEAFETLRDGVGVGCELTPVPGWVEKLRTVKSPEEIAAIRAAVLLNSKALDRALRKVKPGISEIEVAAEIDYQMRKLGADGVAFETIVAAQARAALPHAQPTPAIVKSGQLLLIDMGAKLNGYMSDMTRVVFLGEPDKKTRQLYNAVLESQLAGVAAVRAGVEAGRVDAASRRVLKKHGLTELFVHSTGHGLGLEIHEAPRLGKKVKTVLEAGMAVTIEPGVYKRGICGIRIEDTVVVTENGCEILTPTSKQLTVI